MSLPGRFILSRNKQDQKINATRVWGSGKKTLKGGAFLQRTRKVDTYKRFYAPMEFVFTP
jgi:hypothetical protein